SLATASEWGLGLQGGHGWGFTVQKRTFLSGSLNLGFNDVRAQIDYVWLFTSDFDSLKPGSKYRNGSLVPYLGGGIEATSGFVGVRIPIGVEYTLLRVPVTGFVTLLPTVYAG